MPPDPPEHQGQQAIAPRRRQQHNLQIHPGVQHAAPQGQPLPPQQLHRQHSAPEGAGRARKISTWRSSLLLRQKASSTINTAAAPRHRGRAQKAHPRQEDGHRIQSAQDGPQGKAQPGQGLPRQPGRGQQQQVVHHRVEQKQRVHIDDRHPGPSSPSPGRGPFACPHYRAPGQRNRSESVVLFHRIFPFFTPILDNIVSRYYNEAR